MSPIYLPGLSIPSVLDSVARHTAQLAGSVIGSRRAFNFIEGSGIDITAVDDAVNERVNITLAATGTGGSGGTGSPLLTVSEIDATTTLNDNHEVVEVSSTAGAIDIFLPTAVGRSGKVFIIRRITAGANSVVVKPPVAGGSYSALILSRSPSAYWTLNNTLGDSSGNGFALTNNGAAAFAASILPGDAGQCIDLNGSTQSLSIVDPASSFLLDPISPFTIEAWIKPDVVNADKMIWYGGDGGADLDVASDGKVTARKGSVGQIVKATVACVAATVYHVVWTKSGATSKIYLNGVDRTGAVTDFTLIDNVDVKSIGSIRNLSTFFDGKIQHVAIYPFALSAAQALASYDAGTTGGGTETIDGASTKTLGAQWSTIGVYSNGVSWRVGSQFGTIT